MTALEERARASLSPNPWTPTDRDRFTLGELDKAPPPMRYVWHPYIPEGCACVLTGAGGTSKTGLAVTIAVAKITGVRLLDDDPPQPGRVLIVSAEDRRDILRRHVYTATRDLTPEQRQQVVEGLYVKDVVGSGFRLTQSANGATLVAAEVDDLVDYTQTIEPDLIVLDTLSRLHGGDENNEGLARFVSAMERISTATGSASLILHHTGKGQMRDGVADQYAGRGGSSLSDNARSVMHLARVTREMRDAPTNAADLIATGRLLRLTHAKSNYASAAPDRWIERVPTPYAARLVEFHPQFSKADDASDTWTKIAEWLATQSEVAYPNASTIESLGSAYGSRAQIRRALQWAEDRGRISHAPHPKPQGKRKTYLVLPKPTDEAGAYERASNGE